MASTSKADHLESFESERRSLWRRTIFHRWLKRIQPRTLMVRSLMIIVIPFVVLQMISAWVFYDNHYDRVTKRLSKSVVGEITSVTSIYYDRPVGWTDEQIFRWAWATNRLTVTVENDGILPASELHFFPSILDQQLKHAFLVYSVDSYAMDTVNYGEDVVIWIPGEGNAIFHFVVPREKLFTSTSYIFIAWMIGSALVLSFMAVWVMRNQVRPIRMLAQAAKRFGVGLDVPNFHPRGAAEVKEAGTAFIEMRDRIKRQINQRTAMLAGVSHDLRTPLTRMKLELEMMGDDPAAQNMKLDVQEMEEMIEGYLAFARGEQGEAPEEFELTEILDELIERAKREGAEVELKIEGDLHLTARRKVLQRGLANLVTNALRYGGRVWLAARRDGDKLEITIDDDGPGIPEELREDVFRPFFRLEESRNQETGGTGLGLTIARDAVRFHGGELLLLDRPDGSSGLRARVRIPVVLDRRLEQGWLGTD